MLKHLGTHALTYLADLFTLSIRSLNFPSIWKVARIIPLLKPGKSPDDATSYRPISLLSPVVKLLESLVLLSITPHIELAEHQHGFRKGRSTTTALHLIHDQIYRGLIGVRPCSRTIMVALDLKRAFDTVSHIRLFDDIMNTSIPLYLKHWIISYLRGRNTYVDFRDKTSSHKRMKQVVPQGGVLSPILFNLYLSKIPQIGRAHV